MPSFTVLKTQICVTRPQCVNDSLSRPISGAQVCDAPAKHICTVLGFIIAIGVVVRQAFSLLHFFDLVAFPSRSPSFRYNSLRLSSNVPLHSLGISASLPDSMQPQRHKCSICLLSSPLSVVQCLWMSRFRSVTDGTTLFNFQGFLF